MVINMHVLAGQELDQLINCHMACRIRPIPRPPNLELGIMLFNILDIENYHIVIHQCRTCPGLMTTG